MEKSIKNSSGVVRFAFKETNVNMEKNKKKESPINLVFSYNGKKFKYSTGFKACYDDWDFTKQRVKSNKSLLINAREVNNLLNLIDTSLSKEYSKYISEQVIVTNELLKSYLYILLNKNIVVSYVLIFLPFILWFSSFYLNFFNEEFYRNNK